MGTARWDSGAWDSYAAAHVTGKSADTIFTTRKLLEDFDPAKITLRESRDSDVNPNSTPIIIACDVTGSMGFTANTMISEGLNKVATQLYNRKPVNDPHIMIMALGDCYTDSAPIQATQFEADICLAEQTTQLYVEKGGGANEGESYSGAHAFAAFKTSHDAFEKRGRKGYLFTMGDEPNLNGMTKEQIKKYLDVDVQTDLSAAELFEMASRTYEVFHILLVNEGRCRHSRNSIEAGWKNFMPQRVITLEDASKLAEAVVSAIQVTEGANVATVASSWGGGTDIVIANAISDIAVRDNAANNAVARV